MGRISDNMLRRLTSIPVLSILVFILLVLLLVTHERKTTDVDGNHAAVDENFNVNLDVLENEIEIRKTVEEVKYEPHVHNPFAHDNEDDAVLDEGDTPEQLRPKDESESRARKYHQIWMIANNLIDNHALFPDTEDVDNILDALRTAKIVHADVLDDDHRSRAENWLVTLEGGARAILKLKWDANIDKGTICAGGFEDPASEVAAFHLHRLVGFRNTPYSIGREIDLENDILPVAAPAVAVTITKQTDTPGVCVTAKCASCPDSQTMCKNDGKVLASLSWWIPRHITMLTSQPAKMPFSVDRWEEFKDRALGDRFYCNEVQLEGPYSTLRHFHDLIDFGIIDFFMNHYHTKHFVMDDNSIARGLSVRLDHGKSFCSNAEDQDNEAVFLASITQCCMMRWETWDNLVYFTNGHLTNRLRERLDKEPFHSEYSNDFYAALERRLKKTLGAIDKCMEALGKKKVIVA